MAEGVYYCRPVKTFHKNFCLATLEKLIKDWLGGSYLVLKSNSIVPGGRPLISIGYKYTSCNFLGFISRVNGILFLSTATKIQQAGMTSDFRFH